MVVSIPVHHSLPLFFPRHPYLYTFRNCSINHTVFAAVFTSPGTSRMYVCQYISLNS